MSPIQQGCNQRHAKVNSAQPKYFESHPKKPEFNWKTIENSPKWPSTPKNLATYGRAI